MPLTFDFPLDKLQTYTGTNPRPADFEAFWEDGLAEVRAIDPQVTLEPAGFQTAFADCFDLTITGTAGARVHAQLLRPRQPADGHPAVIKFHGYSGNAGEWSEKLGYVAAGFTVAAMDCRGQGGRSEDPGGVQGMTLRGHIVRGLDGPPQNMLFRHIFLDTVQLARVVMSFPDVDETRVGVYGGSQGGALTLACAALEPRIKRAAPAFPFLCDYQRVWEMDLDEHAYEELRYYFRQFDPRHEREAAVFTQLGYIDVQHLAPRIRGEVLMATSLRDMICPPSTQFAAYNKITAPKEMLLYPDFGHEYLPGFDDQTFQFMREVLQMDCAFLGELFATAKTGRIRGMVEDRLFNEELTGLRMETLTSLCEESNVFGADDDGDREIANMLLNGYVAMSGISVPIECEGGPRGVLAVYSTAVKDLSAAKILFVKSMASVISLFLQSQELLPNFDLKNARLVIEAKQILEGTVDSLNQLVVVLGEDGMMQRHQPVLDVERGRVIAVERCGLHPAEQRRGHVDAGEDEALGRPRRRI